MAFHTAAVQKFRDTPVGPVGYGLMGLTMPWAPIDYPTATKIMKNALERGANFWNGGIHYGTPEANSLHLLKHYFQQYPEDAKRVVLSIKGAYNMKTGPDGSAEGIRASVEEAVRVIGGVKVIDVFQMARIDPNVPLETSINALAELVKEGKIGGIGLSEVGATTIRKAHAIHPISAVEIELSLFTPHPITNGIVDTCAELSIQIAAYSPIGRGWLSGSFRKFSDLSEKDWRRSMPRFQPKVFDDNFKLVEAVEQIAKRKNVTTAQVALAWVCRYGAIPIPGSTNMDRVTENCNAVALTDEDMADLQKIIESLPVSGERYGGEHEKLLNA